jgi:phosphoribosylamine---glycine ligase
LPMASSQDHKAALNGDLGPNTGGMGAYSPAAVFTKDLEERAMREVIMPTVEGMKAEGNTFTGFLYAGLMIAADGTPNVLEYNVRFGDPETQPIMARLDSDLIELIQAGFDGKLDQVTAEWDKRACMGVVMAAGGYPADYPKGDVISGLPTQEIKDKKVFHAGTKADGENTVTNGGRVLCITAKGDTVTAAQESAYELVKQISWDGVYYRTDIGHKEIARENG